MTATGSLGEAQLAFLCSLPSLQTLVLDGAQSLYGTQRLTTLTSVYVSGGTSVDVTPLRDLPQLMSLDAGVSSPGKLLNLSALSSLLVGLSLHSGAWLSGITQLTRLRGLYLSKNASSLTSSAASSRLGRLVQLERLELPALPELVQACTSLPKLSDLRVFGAARSVSAALAELTQLKRLSVFADPPIGAGAGVLAPLSSVQLQQLVVGNLLGETALAHPSVERVIWWFSSSKNSISGKLADMSGCPQLLSLHVGVHADLHVVTSSLPGSLQSLTYSCSSAGKLWWDSDAVVSGLQCVLSKAAAVPSFWIDRLHFESEL